MLLRFSKKQAIFYERNHTMEDLKKNSLRSLGYFSIQELSQYHFHLLTSVILNHFESLSSPPLQSMRSQLNGVPHLISFLSLHPRTFSRYFGLSPLPSLIDLTFSSVKISPFLYPLQQVKI